MIKVLIQAEAGSNTKIRYDEKALKSVGMGRVSQPFPYPYGFVIDTTAPDGDNVDCYVVGNTDLKSDTIVECEPVGLLEQVETGQSDHKVLVVLPGRKGAVPDGVLEVLQQFIYAVFSDYPDESISVGPIRSRDAALQYICECKDV